MKGQSGGNTIVMSEGSPPNAKRRRRWAAIPRWLRLLIIAAAGYATYVVAAWAVQEQFLFPGARRTPAADAESRYPEVQRVWTTGEDGARVEAWYAPGGAASPRGRGPAVMFFHANGDLLDDVWPAVRPYLDRGWSAMCVEYRGYGRSTGRPSQDGIVADCVRFRAWLDARPEVDSGRVIYHGISLGGGVASPWPRGDRPARSCWSARLRASKTSPARNGCRPGSADIHSGVAKYSPVSTYRH